MTADITVANAKIIAAPTGVHDLQAPAGWTPATAFVFCHGIAATIKTAGVYPVDYRISVLVPAVTA